MLGYVFLGFSLFASTCEKCQHYATNDSMSKVAKRKVGEVYSKWKNVEERWNLWHLTFLNFLKKDNNTCKNK